MNSITQDAIDSILDAIVLPEGVSFSAEIELDDDDREVVSMVVVSLDIEKGADFTDDQWEAAESAVDLSSLGLEFIDSGAIGAYLDGGTEYSGTYQQWTPVAVAS